MLTRKGSVVSNKSSKIHCPVVHMQVLHTADKLPGAEGEVVRHVGNSTKE